MTRYEGRGSAPTQQHANCNVPFHCEVERATTRLNAVPVVPVLQMKSKAIKLRPTLEQKLPVAVLLVLSLGDALDPEALPEPDHPDDLLGTDREIVVRVDLLAARRRVMKKNQGNKRRRIKEETEEVGFNPKKTQKHRTRPRTLPKRTCGVVQTAHYTSKTAQSAQKSAFELPPGVRGANEEHCFNPSNNAATSKHRKSPQHHNTTLAWTIKSCMHHLPTVASSYRRAGRSRSVPFGQQCCCLLLYLKDKQ